MRSLRIGVDGSCWANRRGYGRYTRELMRALLSMDRTNRYVLFIDPETNETCEFPEGIERMVMDVSVPPSRAASASGRRSLADMWRMGRQVAGEPLDVLFFPSVYTYFPVFSRARKITAIHDVIAERYPQLVFPAWKNRLFWTLKVKAAIRQADLILTVSEYSKKGIMDYFGLPEERIRVAPEAADGVFRPVGDEERTRAVLGGLGLEPGTRFILYVGGISPHKNLSVLVKAFARLAREPGYEQIRLLLVGDFEKDSFLMDHGIRDEISGLGMAGKVVFAGFVPDDRLVHLYNSATVLVLPSFCEGFGLPALEAMSCGTPVIGSTTTSLPEVVGDAGLFFDPDSAEELTERLRRIFDDRGLRDELGRRSLERAAAFSWTRTASSVLSVFMELAQDVPSS